MNLSFFAGVEYKNKIYFSTLYFNGLFTYDLESEEITFLKLFSDEKMKKRLHRAAFVYNNEAWFIPQEAENIACVNLDTLDITYYKPPYTRTNIDYESDEEYHLYLSGRVVDDRYLYLVPADIDTISVIDMETHEINSVYMIEDGKKERYNDLIVIDNKLWLVPRIGTGLKVMDLETNEIVEKKWEYEDYSYSSVETVNGKLWFSPVAAKKILCVDLETEEHKLFDFDTPDNKYSGVMRIADKIIIFPIDGQNFIILDSLTSKIVVEQYNKYKYIFSNDPNKVTSISSDTKKMITMGGMGYLVNFLENGNIIVMSLNDKEFNISDYRQVLLNEKSIDDIIKCYDIELDEIVGIDNYMNSIVNKKLTKIMKTGKIGNDIWTVISK